LLLGLGGGSIARMFLAWRPSMKIDAVEIDPAVEEIARAYFDVGAFANFQVYIEDAAAYVARAESMYDVIVLDAYTGETLAPQCAVPEFFYAARRRLTGAGVLVVNWMKGDPEGYHNLLANLRDAVGDPWALHGNRSRNTLVFAPVVPSARPDLLARARRVANELPFPSDIVRLAGRLKPG
jgi:spermidine synthase